MNEWSFRKTHGQKTEASSSIIFVQKSIRHGKQVQIFWTPWPRWLEHVAEARNGKVPYISSPSTLEWCQNRVSMLCRGWRIGVQRFMLENICIYIYCIYINNYTYIYIYIHMYVNTYRYHKPGTPVGCWLLTVHDCVFHPTFSLFSTGAVGFCSSTLPARYCLSCLTILARSPNCNSGWDDVILIIPGWKGLLNQSSTLK